jgi:hypothetical protein
VIDSRTEIKTAVDHFLAILEDESADADAQLSRLRRSLDQLAFLEHAVSYFFDEKDYPDAPQQDAKVLRQMVEKRFPELGYYNVPNCVTEHIGETKINVGDAIDDIADIARELYDVRWYWVNTSIDNALWHFQNNYWSHWEEHLRTLQLYLRRLDKGSDEGEE